MIDRGDGRKLEPAPDQLVGAFGTACHREALRVGVRPLAVVRNPNVHPLPTPTTFPAILERKHHPSVRKDRAWRRQRRRSSGRCRGSRGDRRRGHSRHQSSTRGGTSNGSRSGDRSFWDCTGAWSRWRRQDSARGCRGKCTGGHRTLERLRRGWC